MAMQSAPATPQKPFFFAEECNLALLLDTKTGKRTCMDTDIFRDMEAGFRAGWNPLEHPPKR